MKRLRPLSALLVAVFLAAPSVAQKVPSYDVALPGYHYRFPRDNFNHPDYRTEWWYYTGNLWTPAGRRFGFELTFFREGAPSAPQPASVWNVTNVYMAHAALSDIRDRKFYYDERLNRAGPSLAGIDESTSTIWNGNWQVMWRGDTQELRAVTELFNFELVARSTKPPVIQGIDGVSQKGPGRGNASHYISLTRLEAHGTIRVAGQSYQVKGGAWMDHEFFTQPRGDSVAGWDWTCLQFDDNTELMLYRLHEANGSESPYSAGTYVDAEGHARHLTASNFHMQPEAVWVSPRTHGRYPVSWQIKVPSLRIDVNLTTPLKNQELVSRTPFAPTYWEGAIDVIGSKNGKPVHGVGYLELTGYARASRNPHHFSRASDAH
jgi:predicted secreted hydrolase